jgi:hypothetical protein
MPRERIAKAVSLSAGKDFYETMSTKAIKLKTQGKPATRLQPQEGSWVELLARGIPQEVVGLSALKFAQADPNARALVFFGFDGESLSRLLSQLMKVSGLRIVFAKELTLSPVGGLNLIELCYGHKPWISEPITKRMAQERLVLSSSALVVIFTGWERSYERVQDLKAELRSLLPNLTFERRVHGTDDVEDTSTLVEAITSPSALALLNRVRVSRKDRIFARIPGELRANPGICIDGSSVMELYGLRKSRDLDFICSGDRERELVKSLGFDVNNERYEWLPFSAKQVIDDPFLHLTLFGYKFSSLGIRNMTLSFGDYGSSASWSSKKERDFVSISLYNAGSAKMRLGIAGVLGTLATQLRLAYEFSVTKLIPVLPAGLVKLLRAVRHASLKKPSSPGTK